MKRNRPAHRMLVLLCSLGLAACGDPQEATPTQSGVPQGETAHSALHPLPYKFSNTGSPLAREDGKFDLKSYSAALNALSVLATVSRESEYGHPAYRPEASPEDMWAIAEEWLDLVQQMQTMFNTGTVFPAVVEAGEWTPAEGTDLSLFPHLAYAYHIHHRSGRFSENPVLENRLNREASLFLSAPGRYLLTDRFEDGRFFDAEGTVSHRSMASGLGGIHGTAYAWVSWAKPDGEDAMGNLSEAHLSAFLGIGPQALADIYLAVDDYLLEHWSSEHSTYLFDEADTVWDLASVGAMLRGKKAMGDVLYMFGGEPGKARARGVFERTAAMLEAVLPTAQPWGMPSQIDFTEAGTVAAADTVDLYDWYQFLNHLGGGYALDREREGTARYFTRHREDLLEAWDQLADGALKGVLDFHLSDKGFLVRTVRYADGEVVDPELTLATLGMFITTAGNIYGKGDAFARPGAWETSDPDVASRSKALFDLSFKHWALLD